MPYDNLLDFYGTNPNDALGGGGVPQVPVAQMPATPGVSVMDQTPPMPMQGPSGAAAQPAPPPPPYRPSFMDRIQAHLMHVPNGMQGLLSDDDLKNARSQGLLHFGLSMLANAHGVGAGNAPSVGQSLASSYDQGQQAFQGGIDKSVQANVGGLQTAQMLRILQARQQIGQQFAPKEGETRAQAVDRLMQMFHAYAAVGDTDMVGKLSDVIGKLGEDPALFQMEHGKEPLRIDKGNAIEVRSPYPPYTLLGTIPKSAAPVNQQEFGQKVLQDQTTRTTDLVGKYNEETKIMSEAANNLRNISGLQGAAMRGDPASQIGLIDSYLRTINPGGMARPGQITLAADARSLADQAELFKDKIMRGSKLSPNQVRQFVNAAQSVGKQWQTSYQPIAQRYRQWAQQAQVDPNVILGKGPFVGVNFDGGAAGAAPQEGAAPSSGNVRRYLPKASTPAPVAAPLPKRTAPVVLPPTVSTPGFLSRAGTDLQNLLFAPKRVPDNMGLPQ